MYACMICYASLGAFDHEMLNVIFTLSCSMSVRNLWMQHQVQILIHFVFDMAPSFIRVNLSFGIFRIGFVASMTVE